MNIFRSIFGWIFPVREVVKPVIIDLPTDDEEVLKLIECDTAKKEVFDVINGGIDVCCDQCHSRSYDVYPTGINPLDPDDEINDIWYKCNHCGYRWSSGFLRKVRQAKRGF